MVGKDGMVETARRPAVAERCRLCAAPVSDAFMLNLLGGKYHVQYFRCDGCGSLQSERPYWLDDAYAISNLSSLDTGAAQRNLTNLAAVAVWRWIIRAGRVVDVGGGDGLLCRLLRDYGIEARVCDRYATNVYARGYGDGEIDRDSLVTAFEVLEHYADPQADLLALFQSGPRSVMVSTTLYEDQGPNWWYLTPESGQHVFIYSLAAMRLIGDRFGYEVLTRGHYTLFVRNDVRSRWSRMASTLLRNAISLRLLRGLVIFLPAGGATRDFEVQAGLTSPD